MFDIYNTSIYLQENSMDTAKLFKNGKSQAVRLRLPREFKFQGKEVYIKRISENVVLIPQNNPWESLISSLGKFSTDFMSRRRQPALEKREIL